MENNAFDDALRASIAGEELPATTQAWQQMTARLDQHEGIALLIPKSERSRRRYIWLLPAAAAAVLCAVMFRTAFREDFALPGMVTSVQKRAETKMAQSPARPEEKPVANITQQDRDVRTVHGDHPVQYGKSSMPERPSTLQSVNSDTVAIAQNNDGPAAVPHPEAAGYKKQMPLYVGADVSPQAPMHRRTALGVFGGYNIGSAKNDFTLGFAVSKKLGGRLHLETNVAVVTGSYHTYQNVPSQGFAAPGIGAAKASAYEPAPRQLLYLQASPSVSYEVYRGLSAGGGVDAQRLLSGASTAQRISSAGNAEAPQPDWDFGVTGRVDYQIIKKLRAGLMYRNSVYSYAGNSIGAAKRNYLLVQVGYTIF